MKRAGHADLDAVSFGGSSAVASPRMILMIARGRHVFERLRSRFKQPEPAGPPETLRRFGPSDRPIAESGVSLDHDGWRIEAREASSVPLFEVVEPTVEHCLLTYRADLRTSDLDRGAYLEMWCRLPGRGEFFSKGVDQTVSGTTSWSSREVPFYLKAGQSPDLIRLNVALEGAGTVWIRNVEVLRTPLR